MSVRFGVGVRVWFATLFRDRRAGDEHISVIVVMGVCVCGVLDCAAHGGGRGCGYGRDNGIHLNSRGSAAVSSSDPAHGQAKSSNAAIA